MRFSQEFIQRVQEANNIVDLVSQYTVLRPTGAGMMGRCPFPDHPEKTPSFSVSDSKQVYHCFGCQKSGNIFTFLQEYNGFSFLESIEYLAERAHISLPNVNEKDIKKDQILQRKLRELRKLNLVAAQFFSEQFMRSTPVAQPARDYIKSRGLTEEIIENFRLGYADSEWDSLSQYLQKRGIDLSLATELGLIKARTQGEGYYDLFRGRIMFPIIDVKGDVIAFGGRTIIGDEAKYINSPESQLFSKSKSLYGINEAARHIRGEDLAIVVEGYMDVLSLYQVGIKNVVAPMGTALTHDQAKTLRRLTNNILVLFDGDSAGMAAAERSLAILLGADFRCRGIVLPDNLDPDDYIKKFGGDSLARLIAQAPDLFSLLLGKWTDYSLIHLGTYKLQLIDKLKPYILAIKDPRMSDLYIDEISRHLNLENRWVRSSLQSNRKAPSPGGTVSTAAAIAKPPTAPSSARAGAAAITINGVAADLSERSGNNVESTSSMDPEEISLWSLKGADRAEIALIQLAIQDSSSLDFLAQSSGDNGILAQILHKDSREILIKILQLYRQNPQQFDRLGSLVANFVLEPEILLADPLLGPVTEDLPEARQKMLKDVTAKIRSKFISQQAHRLMGDAQTIEDKIENLRKVAELHRIRLGIGERGPE